MEYLALQEGFVLYRYSKFGTSEVQILGTAILFCQIEVSVIQRFLLRPVSLHMYFPLLLS